MSTKKTLQVTLTGNGGTANFDMADDDAMRLGSLVSKGTTDRTFTFTDQRTSSAVTVILDKLFVLEVKDEVTPKDSSR